MEDLGARIARLRKQHNLTQAELGKELNVTPQGVSKWENNLSEPDMTAIVRMCELFHVTTDELLCPENFKKQKEEASSKQREEILAEANRLISATQPEQPSIIVGYCNRCKKPLEQQDPYHLKNGKDGRQLVYCEDCNKAIEQEEKKKKQAAERDESRKALWRGLVIGALIAGAVGLLLYFCVLKNEKVLVAAHLSSTAGIWLEIIFVIGCFATVSQFFWDSFLLDVILFFSRSFRMPGVIFEWSLDGVMFLICMKIVLAVLSFFLSLSCFLFGFLLCMVISYFTFPVALVQQIRKAYPKGKKE